MNNVRNIELDQMAARALCNPQRRDELLRRISPNDAPARKHLTQVRDDIRNGYLYSYPFVPEGMMFRGINTGLNRIFEKGVLEYSQLRLDKRGHFFAFDRSWAADHAFETPKDNDAVLLGVSHHTANIWAAHDALDIFEDIGKASLDPSMRAYCSRTNPDIPIEDIDIFIVLDRPVHELEQILKNLPKRLREPIRKRILMAPIPADPKTNMTPYIANFCKQQGVQTHPAADLVKNLFELTFWEMQRRYLLYSNPIFGRNPQQIAFYRSVKAMRRVISACPEYWGKKNNMKWFDPLGLIEYLINTGRASE